MAISKQRSKCGCCIKFWVAFFVTHAQQLFLTVCPELFWQNLMSRPHKFSTEGPTCAVGISLSTVFEQPMRKRLACHCSFDNVVITRQNHVQYYPAVQYSIAHYFISSKITCTVYVFGTVKLLALLSWSLSLYTYSQTWEVQAGPYIDYHPHLTGGYNFFHQNVCKIIVVFPRWSNMSPRGKCCSVWGM